VDPATIADTEGRPENLMYGLFDLAFGTDPGGTVVATFYLEDPLHQDDFRKHKVLTHSLRGRALVVGDDLYCTDMARLRKGIKERSTNSILIKPNQAGTLSKAIEVVKKAAGAELTAIPSHRSGETDDDWLADLSLAWGAGLIKTGISGLDTPKLNRLIELWEDIPRARMAIPV
jgi:enolase